MTALQAQTSEKRDRILERVLNLRAKAENAGSSEAEMNTAFTMAAKLMDAYNIEEAELALAESEGRIVLDVITKQTKNTIFKGSNSGHKHKVLGCLWAITKFTETKSVYSTYDGKVTFTGHRPDVEMAEFLFDVIKNALDNAYDNYRRANSGVGYGAKTSFQLAMGRRINERLIELVNARDAERAANKKKAQALAIEDQNTASSTALIISEIAEQKTQEVLDAYKRNYSYHGRWCSCW